jgi:microcystin-dependent protein
VGQGPGLSQYDIGQSGGVETVSLSTISVPPHNHQILASTIGGTSKDPTAHYFATNNAKPYGKLPAQAHSTATPTPMAAGILVSSPAQPHDNMAPFQALTFIIALFGIFPSRN